MHCFDALKYSTGTYDVLHPTLRDFEKATVLSVEYPYTYIHTQGDLNL
jgi:hypothetical protein